MGYITRHGCIDDVCGFYFAQGSAARILGMGRIPRHIAIVMDGNRRYATRRGLPKLAGHHHGSDSLLRALTACLELGVECVSVYAFRYAMIVCTRHTFCQITMQISSLETTT